MQDTVALTRPAKRDTLSHRMGEGRGEGSLSLILRIPQQLTHAGSGLPANLSAKARRAKAEASTSVKAAVDRPAHAGTVRTGACRPRALTRRNV